jgi:hypothetical protein
VRDEPLVHRDPSMPRHIEIEPLAVDQRETRSTCG